MIQTARELIQGEPTIVLGTKGYNLTEPTAEGHGHGMLGWWNLDRKRVAGCTRVVVYHRPEGIATARVLIGSYTGIEDAEDNSGKVAVAFIKERAETTDSDWATFSDSLPGTSNFRRYLNC